MKMFANGVAVYPTYADLSKECKIRLMLLLMTVG
jgi:hypothetical protein